MNIIRKKIEAILLFAGVAVLAFAACNENKNPEVDPTDPNGEDTTANPPAVVDTTPKPGATARSIPLSGNTYWESGSGYGLVGDAGITGWIGAVFNTYFRVNYAGDLSLFLKYTTPESSFGVTGSSVIDVAFGPAPAYGEPFAPTDTFRVILPKTAKGKDSTVFVGKLSGLTLGYKRIDFKGVSRGGEFYSSLKTLIVEGRATMAMSYSKTERRNSPSVHMGYEFPSTDTVEWFYNEVTVPDGMDQPATYFMVNGFKEGYSGIQPNRGGGTVRALFSVWAPFSTDNPTAIPDSLKVPCLAIGDGVCYQQFGGEGSGTQTFYQAVPGWQTGATYKFLVRVCPATTFGFTDFQAADHVAYFYDPAVGAWKLIAHLRRPKPTNNYKWYSSAYSFLENFSGESGNLLRKVYFGNQWIRTKNGQWKELREGHFTTDATGSSGERRDYKGGVEDGKFFLQNGGFFSDNATPGDYFTRPTTGTPPDIDFAALEQLRLDGTARVGGPTKGGACD
jgi:hypothetical protein